MLDAGNDLHPVGIGRQRVLAMEHGVAVDHHDGDRGVTLGAELDGQPVMSREIGAQPLA